MRDWLVAGALLEGPEGLLLVCNRRRDGSVDWSPPGGVIDEGETVLEGLSREVHEETGLTIAVGDPALVNEFHDPATGFHQVDVYFHARLVAGDIDAPWTDPEGVVTRRRWVSRAELAGLRHKPDSLAAAASNGAPPAPA